MHLPFIGKTYSLLHQVYGDELMSPALVFEWHKHFEEGQEDIKDDPCPGCPSTLKNE
jgi:hypothetical protein